MSKEANRYGADERWCRARNVCLTCNESISEVCPASKRSCGHHCNHLWTHDQCCWCGITSDDNEERKQS